MTLAAALPTNEALFGTIVVTGLSVAFLHAALPTHWLPFVLAGRRQRWDHGKTLAVTALAGGGHVFFTVVLGVFVAVFGLTLDRWTGGVFPYIAASVLIFVGLYFWNREGHGHSHFVEVDPEHGHSHDHDHAHEHSHGDHHHAAPVVAMPAPPRAVDDRAVVVGLLAALTFSPCEGFLPVFAAAVKFGWTGFALLCVILAVATLAGMLLMTWLTMKGIQHARFDRLEGHEGKISGALLMLLGVAVIILES